MITKTVGVLGGGQLGRMMAEAGHRLGIRLVILDPNGCLSPAGQVAELSIEGSIQDSDKIRELSAMVDVMTVEIEHVNAEILEELESNGCVVHPSGKTIRLIQDKYRQKAHLAAHDIPLPEFMDCSTLDQAHEAGIRYGYPFMLKNKRLAYDGRGNAVVKSEADISIAFQKLGGRDIYAERWIPFVKELAVMVVNTKSGAYCYPVVETIQENNICHMVIAPAMISSSATSQALDISKRAIESFSGYGVYGVELFLLPDDSTILNEIAPRPHNSGHYTMEACEIDQFEMHLRAILGLPFPSPAMRVSHAIMINVLGKSTMEETKDILIKALCIPGCGVHWYGKSESREGRKMAHITITGESADIVTQRVKQLGYELSSYGYINRGPRVGVIMGSDSDLDTMKDAAEILDKFGVSYELTIVSAHRTPTRMYTYAQSAAERGLQVIVAGAGGAAHLPGMIAALTSLPVIGVPIMTSSLNGQDSLLSIVQMPKGVPVATVAIGNAINAGLLAVRILAASDASLLKRMDDYLINQEDEVLYKAKKLETVGYQAYMQPKK